MRYDNPKIIERIEKSKNSIVGYLSVTNNSGRKQESLNMIIRSFYEQNTRANVFGNVRLLADFLVSHVNVPGVAYRRQGPFYVVNLKYTRWRIRKHYNNKEGPEIWAELIVKEKMRSILDDCRLSAETILAIDHFFPEFERMAEESVWEAQKIEFERKVVNTTNKYR